MNINKIARIAGLLTMLMVILAPFSMIYVPTTLIVPDNAATTAANIMASQGLFRLGMASDLLVVLIEVALTALLYVLIKPVNKTLALVATFARLSMTILQAINLFNHFLVLLLLNGANYLGAFTSPQINALVMLFLNAHESVVLIWGLLFSLHLLIFGYLAYQSGYLPKIIGILLIIVGLNYLISNFGTILLPQYKALFTSLAAISFIEVAFPLWLLIKGVKLAQWKKYA